MKSLLTSLLLVFPLITFGQELLLGKKKIQFQKLEGLTVNAECAREAKLCLELISKAPVKTETPGPLGTLGNPASKYCGSKGGASVILEDKGHNQYDYCVFKEKYLVDSWDLYRKEKK